MKELDEAWAWYGDSKKALRTIGRLAAKHWDTLNWEGNLGRDEKLKELTAPALSSAAENALRELDDLAIVVLFAAFEAGVRSHVVSQVEMERKLIKHPALQYASDEALGNLARGSFQKVLTSLKSIDKELAEQVSQIRRYRNWVTHGRRGSPAERWQPRAAYDRLRRFWALVDTMSSASEPQSGTAGSA
jgi:hypothetical protein